MMGLYENLAKLDYTEAARSRKLSREDKKKNAAQNKSLTSEEVGIYKLWNF